MTITSESFDARIVPDDITAQILAAGLQGAPLFSSLTQRRTENGSVVFPVADPTGFDWTGELGLIPGIDPQDDAVVVAPAKIAGILPLSSEAVADASFPVADELARLIRDGMAAKADTDMCYGVAGNPAAPAGFHTQLPASTGPSLRAAVITAAADILSNGGNPNLIVISPTQWAEEMTRREATQAATTPLFSDLGLPNLTVKVAATLKPADGLVLDTSAAFAITRSDYQIAMSDQAPGAWERDGWAVRVKARIAAVVPTPDKHARAITITP